MKKYIYKTIIISLPILILLFLVNYFGDAGRLFDNDYEKQMAQIIASGDYVTNFQNFDERLFQKELVLNEKILPNIVIIGSSRTMLLKSDHFPYYSLFNNSVSGASIEDIVSIFQMYKDNNKLPEKIIIGIDPWTFNKNNGKSRWKSISEYYYRFLGIENQETTNFFKYKELFSFSYFQNSLKMMPRFFTGDTKPQASTKKYNYLPTRLTDGSLIYGEEYREASLDKILDKIKAYSTGDIYSVENFNAISEKAWNELENLIAEMKKNNVKFDFFLAPYAPSAYDKIQKSYPMVLETERLIKEYALLNNIKVYGSFNPNLLGLDVTNFYDGMHCNESGIKKIIQLDN